LHVPLHFERIDGLHFAAFGIELDEERNAGLRGEGKISRDGAAVTVLVLPADEETIVARAVGAFLGF
jgi:acetate kinase